MVEMRVFVVGYMGAGKSSSGLRLAKLMNLPFFDTDSALSERHERSISALFDQHGEAAFRQMECDILRELVARNPMGLISTGGGTPCHGANMDFMRDNGTVVYLKMPAESLVERLRGRAAQRPLLAGLAADEMLAFVTDHLARRSVYYERAHITVDARHFNLDRMKSVRSLIEGRTWFNPSEPPRQDRDH